MAAPMLPQLNLADASTTNTTSGAAAGAKYFGTGLAASSVANPNAPDKNAKTKMLALVIVGSLVAFFIYKKVK